MNINVNFSMSAFSSVYDKRNEPKNNHLFNSRMYSANLTPLKCDTVSFGLTKKSQYDDIDLLVVNKLKAPIEKFNSTADFHNWCHEQYKNKLYKRYKAKDEFAQDRREDLLYEWASYLKENKFSSSVRLLVIDSITKDLNSDNNKLPPVLSPRVFNYTISQIRVQSANYRNLDINFAKVYSENLKDKYLSSYFNKNNRTGWIEIPSKKHDDENFEDNVDILKTLSHYRWCTNTYNGELYLKKGDIHLYLEDGNPAICVRFMNDKIEEIRGISNNEFIAEKYRDIINEHIEDYQISDNINEIEYVSEKN